MAIKNTQYLNWASTKKIRRIKKVVNSQIKIEVVKTEWDKNKVVKEIDTASKCLECKENPSSRWIRYEVI